MTRYRKQMVKFLWKEWQCIIYQNGTCIFEWFTWVYIKKLWPSHSISSYRNEHCIRSSYYLRIQTVEYKIWNTENLSGEAYRFYEKWETQYDGQKHILTNQYHLIDSSTYVGGSTTSSDNKRVLRVVKKFVLQT